MLAFETVSYRNMIPGSVLLVYFAFLGLLWNQTHCWKGLFHTLLLQYTDAEAKTYRVQGTRLKFSSEWPIEYLCSLLFFGWHFQAPSFLSLVTLSHVPLHNN